MHDTDLGPGRPDADECLPYYFQYIGLVPDGHVVTLLERQIAESAQYLTAFTPEQALWREAPGEWNIVEIVGHLADTERVFGYRALRIARADPVMWTGVEFGDYAAAANFQKRPLGGARRSQAAVSRPRRNATKAARTAAYSTTTSVDWTLRSVRAVAYAMAGHELHHLASIRRQHGG